MKISQLTDYKSFRSRYRNRLREIQNSFQGIQTRLQDERYHLINQLEQLKWQLANICAQTAARLASCQALFSINNNLAAQLDQLRLKEELINSSILNETPNLPHQQTGLIQALHQRNLVFQQLQKIIVDSQNISKILPQARSKLLFLQKNLIKKKQFLESVGTVVQPCQDSPIDLTQIKMQNKALCQKLVQLKASQLANQTKLSILRRNYQASALLSPQKHKQLAEAKSQLTLLQQSQLEIDQQIAQAIQQLKQIQSQCLKLQQDKQRLSQEQPKLQQQKSRLMNELQQYHKLKRSIAGRLGQNQELIARACHLHNCLT